MQSLLQKLGVISILACCMPMMYTQETHHAENFVRVISQVINNEDEKNSFENNIKEQYEMKALYSDLDDNKLALLSYNLKYVNNMIFEGTKSGRYAITAQRDEKKTGSNVGGYEKKLDLVMLIQVAFDTILHEITHRKHFTHPKREEFEEELKPYLDNLGDYYKTQGVSKNLWKKGFKNTEIYVTPYANSSLHEFVAETNEALGTCYYYGSGPLASRSVYDRLDTKKLSEVVNIFQKYGFISKEIHDFFTIYLHDEQLRDVLSEYVWPLSDMRRYKENDYVQVFPCIEDNFESLTNKSNLVLFLDKAHLMNQQQVKNSLLRYYNKMLPIIEYKKNGDPMLSTWAAYQDKIRASVHFKPSQRSLLLGEEKKINEEKGIAYAFKSLKKLNELYKKTTSGELYLGYPLELEEVKTLEKHFPHRTADSLMLIAQFYHKRLNNLKPVKELYQPSKFYDLPSYLEVTKTKLFYDEILSYYLKVEPLKGPLLQTGILLQNRKQIKHYKYLNKSQQVILNRKLVEYFGTKYPNVFK